MIRRWIQVVLAGLIGLAAACSTHRVELKPTHHTVEVKPIYLTVDVNIRVQKELERFFEDVEKSEHDEREEGEGT